VVRSRALRRDKRVTLYLPARFRRAATYPLLVVHDHSWENWRDSLRDALSWVFPGPQKLVYE
jgi:hypothetical protein